jgi:MFS superfamily sulfate permease-like transporter
MKNKKLAKQISKVLKNPATPQPLKDTIHDALDFMYQYVDHDSMETIELFLNGYKERGKGAEIEVTRSNGISVVGEGEKSV